MKMNLYFRDRGLDEIIREKSENSRGKDLSPRAPRRMNMPIFETFETANEADKSLTKGFVYAVRTSNPYSGICNGLLGLRYVKIPSKDPSLARHAYLEWIKAVNSPLQLANRHVDHLQVNGTPYYQIHATAKLIKTI